MITAIANHDKSVDLSRDDVSVVKLSEAACVMLSEEEYDQFIDALIERAFGPYEVKVGGQDV